MNAPLKSIQPAPEPYTADAEAPAVRPLGETALRVVRTSGEAHIAVVEGDDAPVFVGCLHERDAMAAYNRALIDARRQEQE